MPDNKRRSRAWVYGSNTVISTLFFLGILVFIVLIAEKHPWRMDLTESGSFTLSEQTRNVLKTLDQPIQVKGFFATAAQDETKARDLLETYRFQTDNIRYEFIDPDRNPELARRYEIRTYGTLVLEGYGRRQTVQAADEENLTNAILKLVREQEKKIYFLKGHGERSFESADKDGYSNLRSSLARDNYAVEELNLLQQAEVPDDAAVLVIAGPKKPLFPQELDSIRRYLDRGGRVTALLDPYHDGGMREFLAGYGIELIDDIVIDKLSRVFGGSYLMPVVSEYGSHKITENFGIAAFFPEARSVRPMENPPDGIHLETLASTSPESWSETNLKLLEEEGQAAQDEMEDRVGLVPLAVLAEIDSRKPAEKQSEKKGEEDDSGHEGKTAYLLVVGDSDFVGNTYFNLSGNGDLFLNMMNFMAEEESLIRIEPREKGGQLLLLSPSQAQVLFFVAIVLMPLVVILSGLTVYRFRRARR